MIRESKMHKMYNPVIPIKNISHNIKKIFFFFTWFDFLKLIKKDLLTNWYPLQPVSELVPSSTGFWDGTVFHQADDFTIQYIYYALQWICMNHVHFINLYCMWEKIMKEKVIKFTISDIRRSIKEDVSTYSRFI